MISRILRALWLALKGAWQCKIYLLNSCRSVAAKGFFFLPKKSQKSGKNVLHFIITKWWNGQKGFKSRLVTDKKDLKHTAILGPKWTILSLSLAIIWLYSWHKFYFSFLKSICQVKVETTAMTMGCHHLSSSTQCAWRFLPIVMMAGAWEQILKAVWRPWQREKKWRKVALEAALCLVAMCISNRPLPLIFFSHWP